jgi:hypothetical protein
MVLASTIVSPAVAADPVQRVDVRVTIEGGDPHPLVRRRVVEAIASAAERLLIGRDSEVVARQSPAFAGVLREVTDRVISGYRVVEIGLQAGATTGVGVRLQPRGAVMSALPVAIAMPGVHPDVQPLVRDALAPAVADLSRLPERLPVEALGWAGPLFERQITELIEASAPGFTAGGRVEAEPVPRVAVVVTAKDARIIRDIGVRFRSSSIPYALLSGHAPQVASMAEPLRGLPVTFATAQRSRLEALLRERLAAYPPAREYAVDARPLVQVAEVTYVTVLADSTIYRGRLEARLNFGTSAPPPDVRAQVGRAFGAFEPFVELILTPSTLAVQSALGLRIEVGTHLAIGAVARFDSGGLAPFLSYRLSPDLAVHAWYAMGTGVVEGTLSYRLNETFSVEAVATSTSVVWLRLVGNL